MEIMQKQNSGFSLLKFKVQAKIKYSNLLTFFFLLIYNKFVISQSFTETEQCLPIYKKEKSNLTMTN